MCKKTWTKNWTECVWDLPGWTAQFPVWKTNGKDSTEACAIACQNCAVYSVFPSGMTSYSKIAQLNWECIAPSRRGSVAARLLGLWVQIPPEAWMFVVSVVCRPVEVSASGWSLVRRSPTAKCGMSECDNESSIKRRPWPTGGCCTMIKKVQ